MSMKFGGGGFDRLTRQLQDAQRALNSLDGAIGTISIDPATPETAVREMEQMIDNKVAAYRSNPLVAKLVTGLKERYRAKILQRARQARTKAPEATERPGTERRDGRRGQGRP